MSLHPTLRSGPTAGRDVPAGLVTHMCALCETVRVSGGSLESSSAAVDDALWVCDDCQHKLARRLDDEGALGG